jgi:hypothetical protein
MQGKMPPMKRSTSFQEKHAVQYGLEISTRDPEKKAVTAVMCRFCRFFGREAKVGQKRKPTSVTKSFKVPFQRDVCFLAKFSRVLKSIVQESSCTWTRRIQIVSPLSPGGSLFMP